jgi:hypothetical protein
MVPHPNIEHENKNIFGDHGSTVWWGWGVVSCLEFQIPDLKKREKRRDKEFEKVSNK